MASLPTDVLFIIINYLDVQSFISLSNTSIHLKNVLDQLSVWKMRYDRSFRSLWGKDQTTNTKEDWYTKFKQAYVKRKSIAVIYAYDRLYEYNHLWGIYLHRTCALLSSYGFKVSPIEIHQPDFNNSKLQFVISTLEEVSAVLFFSNGYFSHFWDELGNALASYIDTGHSVVVGTFGNCTLKEAPGGAWRDRDLNPIGMKGQRLENQTFCKVSSGPSGPGPSDPGPSSAYILHDPVNSKAENGTHPMLTGVEYFTIRNNIATGLVKKGSEVIAWYNSGIPMAVWMQEAHGSVLSLNFVPSPGKANIIGGWDGESGNQAGRMVANAMWWALNNEWAAERLSKVDIQPCYSTGTEPTDL